jgi:mono/diheme cytochrome c family protein
MVRVLVAAGAALFWLALPVWAAPPETVAPTPPVDLASAQAIAAGQRLYSTSCSHYCHGPRGGQGLGPKLRGREFDPYYLYGRISSGAPPMPSWGRVFTPEQIWDLVAYIESLKNLKE